MKKLFLSLIVVSCLAITVNAFADSSAVVDNVNAGAESAIIDNSVNTDKSRVYNRQFVNPGVTPLPQTNGFFTAPTPDSSFRSIRDILRAFGDGKSLRLRMSEGALERLAKGGDVVSHLQIFRGDEQVPRIYTKDFDGDKFLTIGIEDPIIEDGKVLGTKKIDGLTTTGLIDGAADDADTKSLQVIGKAGLKALKDGNNFMIITAEGAHRKVEASGWGIGFYTVGGQVSDGGQTSGIVGGGTGYAQNETGPEDRPWIQGYVGVKDDPMLKSEKEDKAVDKADVQTGNHKS